MISVAESCVMKIGQVTDMALVAKIVANGTIFVLSYWTYPPGRLLHRPARSTRRTRRRDERSQVHQTELLYFHDVTAAESISIDGQDIRDVTLTSLRDILGAVPQDPSVFDRTLMQNLLYARPGAPEAEVVEDYKAARIYHQIMKFPQGYRTKLGERGVRHSGGELQRLAIARVILRQPKIVVLDEVMSAVDSETDSLIQ
ncbi:hypothetical protein E4U19_006766 [Claviceps sp. Clav32 group G5]|nr:hypothetical protein E4U19_006766 [Claviceps sp. Clav32 group G5]KAG6022885.1 hypothetical protein E4U40_004301 [Claviceps sp. LM458 group G5]